MTNKSLYSAAALLLSLTCLSDASAYHYYVCGGEPITWDTDQLTLRYSTTSFPNASTWRSALTRAATRFSDNPSRFPITLQSDTSVGLGNGQSEVWVANPGGVSGAEAAERLQDAAAITKRYYDCYWFFGWTRRYKEADIVFNAVPPGWQGWSASEHKNTLSDYGGNGLSMTMVAMHEMGHAIGLNHEEDEYNLMHGRGAMHLHTNGAYARGYVGEDTAAGAVFLYGRDTYPRRDMGVSHWRYQGQSWGTPSTHARTGMRRDDGSFWALKSYRDDGETRYYVESGQRVEVEFTYETNDATTHNGVSVGFYISTDAAISTADRPIRSTWMDLAPNDVYTRKHSLTIPSSLSPGKYWLGVVIDEDNAIAEINEWNNATYIPIHVCQRYGCVLTLPPAPLPPLG